MGAGSENICCRSGCLWAIFNLRARLSLCVCSSSTAQFELNPDSRVVQGVSLANCQTGYHHKEDSKAYYKTNLCSWLEFLFNIFEEMQKSLKPFAPKTHLFRLGLEAGHF